LHPEKSTSKNCGHDQAGDEKQSLTRQVHEKRSAGMMISPAMSEKMAAVTAENIKHGKS
jgi:hypothetical protein